MPGTLYAWVRPALSHLLPPGQPGGLPRRPIPVDHTWVTSYDIRVTPYPDVSAVVSAAEDYWYCYGNFYSTAGTRANRTGLIGSAGADLALARCVVTQNQDSWTNLGAKGTVFVYGVDGSCHQLANQVLYATGVAGARLTVSGVWGYVASVAAWGPLGLHKNRFLNKFALCRASNPSLSARETMDEPSDEFDERVQQIVAERNPDLAQKLLARRRQLQQESNEAPAYVNLKATDDRVNCFLADARSILGDQLYLAFFEMEPGQPITFPNPAEAVD